MPGSILTPEERQLVEGLLGETTDESLRRRARLILQYDDGHATKDAAQEGKFSRGRARYWKRQFQLRRMAVFSHGSDRRAETPPAEVEEQPTEIAVLESPPEAITDSDSPLVEETQPQEQKTTLEYWLAAAQSKSGPGVLPDDPLAEAGRKVWRYQFAHMLLHEQGTALGEDIEELHDMRVATRRMRAAFEVFGGSFSPKALKKHLSGLRLTGRALGKVRDLDVFIEKALHYQEGLPEAQHQDIQPLLDVWRQEREAARQEMIAYLQGSRYPAFKEKFFKFLATPGEGALPPALELAVPYLVRAAVPVLVYNRLAAVRAFDTILESASLEQFHALRIEFKKLRYTLEYFSEVLGPEAKGVINEIKKLQDHLGDLNDAQVAAGILRDFLVRWDALQETLPVAERRGPEPILAYLSERYAERQRLILSFKGAWQRFNRPELRLEIAKAVSVL